MTPAHPVERQDARPMEIGAPLALKTVPLSPPTRFDAVDWTVVPDTPGVYVIYDRGEVIYVGMAGRDGRGSLRRRLRDHSTGQVVNMFAQYLYFARVQFETDERITHPRQAKAACHAYIRDRCSFSFIELASGREARELETRLKEELRPALNGPARGGS